MFAQFVHNLFDKGKNVGVVRAALVFGKLHRRPFMTRHSPRPIPLIHHTMHNQPPACHLPVFWKTIAAKPDNGSAVALATNASFASRMPDHSQLPRGLSGRT